MAALLLFWLIMFRRVLTENYQTFTAFQSYWYYAVVGVFFLLSFIGRLIGVNYLTDHPAANITEQFPVSIMVLKVISLILFSFFVIHILVCSVMMIARWKTRPVRHKSFFVITISNVLILIVSRPS